MEPIKDIVEHTPNASTGNLKVNPSLIYFLIIAMVGAGTAFMLMHKIYLYEKSVSEDIVTKTLVEVIPKQKDTVSEQVTMPFGVPAHIVGAVLNESSTDKIRSINGVYDSVIKKINDIINEDVYDTEDTDEDGFTYYESSTVKIQYIDRGVVMYVQDIYSSMEGSAHPNSELVQNYIDLGVIGLPRKKNIVLFSTKKNTDDIDPAVKVLEHFYPDLQQAYDDAVVDRVNDEYGCYFDSIDPYSELIPELIPQTGQVGFKLNWPHAAAICVYEPPIFTISVSDILKQVPQYVPKDSILWKFK